MRPARIVATVLFAAAVAVTGCTGHPTVAHPRAAAPAPTRPYDGPAPLPATISRTAHPSAPSPTRSPIPPPRGPVACRAAQVQLRAVQDEGAQGRRYLTYAFRNHSAVPCTLSGAPGVQLLDAHGGLLPIVQQPRAGSSGSVGTMLLRPGGSAFFTLQEVTNPEWGEETLPCPAATTLVVTLPHQRQVLTIPATIIGSGTEAIAPCGGGLWVSPVRPTV